MPKHGGAGPIVPGVIDPNAAANAAAMMGSGNPQSVALGQQYGVPEQGDLSAPNLSQPSSTEPSSLSKFVSALTKSIDPTYSERTLPPSFAEVKNSLGDSFNPDNPSHIASLSEGAKSMIESPPDPSSFDINHIYSDDHQAFRMVDPTGKHFEVPLKNYDAALLSGWRFADNDFQDLIDANLASKGNAASNAQGFAEGFNRQVFGASPLDQAIRQSKTSNPLTLANDIAQGLSATMASNRPSVRAASTVAGTIAPIASSLFLGPAAEAAGLSVARGIGGTALRATINPSTLSRLAGVATSGAISNAPFMLAPLANDVIDQNPKLAAEHLASGVGLGAALGVGAHYAVPGAIGAVRGAIQGAGKVIENPTIMGLITKPIGGAIQGAGKEIANIPEQYAKSLYDQFISKPGLSPEQSAKAFQAARAVVIDLGPIRDETANYVANFRKDYIAQNPIPNARNIKKLYPEQAVSPPPPANVAPPLPEATPAIPPPTTTVAAPPPNNYGVDVTGKTQLPPPQPPTVLSAQLSWNKAYQAALNADPKFAALKAKMDATLNPIIQKFHDVPGIADMATKMGQEFGEETVKQQEQDKGKAPEPRILPNEQEAKAVRFGPNEPTIQIKQDKPIPQEQMKNVLHNASAMNDVSDIIGKARDLNPKEAAGILRKLSDIKISYMDKGPEGNLIETPASSYVSNIIERYNKIVSDTGEASARDLHGMIDQMVHHPDIDMKAAYEGGSSFYHARAEEMRVLERAISRGEATPEQMADVARLRELSAGADREAMRKVYSQKAQAEILGELKNSLINHVSSNFQDSIGSAVGKGIDKPITDLTRWNEALQTAKVADKVIPDMAKPGAWSNFQNQLQTGGKYGGDYSATKWEPVMPGLEHSYTEIAQHPALIEKMMKNSPDHVPATILTANAEGTAKLKAVSDLIAKSPLKNSPFAASNDPIAKLRGDAGNGLSHKQQAEKLYDLVTMNPETSRRLLAASISNIANQHPKIAEPLLQTLLAKQEAVRKAIAPTQNTNMPSPFEKEQTFKAPANAERQADNDLKLIQNPYYIMQKAKEGTVTAHDYDVVRSVHPEILRSLGQSILAASQKGTTLSYKERQSYSVIVPGLERTHAKVSSFQQTYANGTLSGGPPPGPPSGPSRKAMPNIGIGSFTPGQRIMGGGKH